MNTLQLINHIAKNSEHYNVVVIMGDDDRTPIQAIEHLSGGAYDCQWRINASLEKNTLLIY